MARWGTHCGRSPAPCMSPFPAISLSRSGTCHLSHSGETGGYHSPMTSSVPNHALRQLRAGKLAIGLGLNLARTVNVAQIARTAGFDWLFIDCEHSSMDLDMAAQISAASLAVGVTPVVRVAGLEHWHASRLLDNGAQGIVFPHVDTQIQAHRAANACRYPPIGKRSMGGGLQQLGFASMPVGAAARIVNAETLLVVMLDSPQRLEP